MHEQFFFLFLEHETSFFLLVTIYLALYGIALAVNDGVRSDDAVRAGIGFDHFEFHRSHTSAHDEIVVFVDWTISLEEVRLQINFENVPDKIRNRNQVLIDNQYKRLKSFVFYSSFSLIFLFLFKLYGRGITQSGPPQYHP